MKEKRVTKKNKTVKLTRDGLTIHVTVPKGTAIPPMGRLQQTISYLEFDLCMFLNHYLIPKG